MKKEKIYFSDIDGDYAHSIDYLIEEMKEQELEVIQVSEAERELATDYFYCKSIGEVFIKAPEGEPCGKECDDYEPRNGKSGCCKHRGFCYVPGKEFSLNVNGQLTPMPPLNCH